jgi:transcriptional regulator with XRE-family HTH domain
MDSINSDKELRIKHILPLLLKKHEMTASQLARKSSVPKSVISDWIGGSHPRNLLQVIRVAKIFNVSMEMLCFGLDQPRYFPEGQRIKGVIEGDFVIIKHHHES